MTSKISYIKLIRQDMRHRGWIFSVNNIILFLAMPVYAAMRLDVLLDSADSYTELPPYLQEQVTNIFPGLINGCYSMFVFSSIALLAILNAVSGFSYLHSRKKQDFYHSLPVKRIQWYITNILTGLLMFLIPYFICTFLLLVLGGTKGILNSVVFQDCIIAALEGILAFAVLYFTGIIACMLTGNMITSFLALIVISVYPVLLVDLIPLLKSTFFDTYYSANIETVHRLGYYLSPALVFRTLLNTPASYGFSLSTVTAALGILLLFLASSFLLYRIYPAQSAGRSLSFPGTAPVFKLLICIPGALFISFLVQSFTGVSGKRWIIALSLLTVILLCVATEFIYEQDLRLILKNWKSSLASLLAVSAILLVFGLDLFGYDTWIPEKNKITKMAFYPDSFSGYFQYPGPYTTPLQNAVYTENVDALSTLAKEGISNLADGINSKSVTNASESGTMREEYMNIVFSYQLNNGKTVRREYALSNKNALNTLDTLCKDESYRKELFPVFHLNREEIRSISVSDLYNIEENLKLSVSEINDLLDAYEKDILSADIPMLNTDTPLGEMTVYVPNPYASESSPSVQPDHDTLAPYENASLLSVSGLYIYSGYTNTLNYLNSHNITLKTEISPDDVENICLHPSATFLQSDTYKDMISLLSASAQFTSYSETDYCITVSSRDDISIVLKYLTPYTQYLLGGTENDWENSAEITFKNGKGSSGFYIS